jgi:predicted MPP superfamily phosphohydrolase
MSQQTVFYIMISIVFSMLHYYLGNRLIRPLDWPRTRKALAWAGVAGIAVFQIVASVVYRQRSGSDFPLWLSVMMWTTYLTMGLNALLALLFFARDLLRLGFWVKDRVQRMWTRTAGNRAAVDASRRQFLTSGVNLGLVGAAVGLSGAGLFGAVAGPRVEDVQIFIPRLPHDLDGFRIVQLTDMHVGPTLKRDFVEQVVRLTQQQRPDAIVMTGDMIDGFVPQLAYDLEPLTTLSAPFGKFWVTGNHEYYWGVKEWVEHARRLGFDVLNNEHRVIERGAGKLVMAGVTDYQGGRFLTSHASDPLKAISGAPLDAHARILLAHQPKSCFVAADAGFDLQLSGHTHGGQFIPWNFLVPLQQPFVSGLDRYKNLQVYTCRGAGYWGPPIRLGIPAELTVIVLRTGPHETEITSI